MLNELGYNGLAEGPVFGNLTERRLTEFQRASGLQAHGIADEPTIKALTNAYENMDSEFEVGDEHPTVTEIKIKLNRLSFNGLAEGPVFGNLTKTRIKEFQEYYGLPVTGVADEQTQDKLDEVYNSPYQNGKTNAYTTEIKTMLNGLGYNGLAEGPVFGNLTETRVKEFQADKGLRAHGIVDEVTLSALHNAFEQAEFEIGDYHPTVIEIKQKLNRLGFDGLALTGNFASFTKQRVEEFQDYFNLPVTGVADERTQEKLDEVYNSPYQNGKSASYTTEIKQMLNAIGYGGLAEGPVFGNLTERRIKEFQEYHNLVVNGIADEVTIAKLQDVFEDRITYQQIDLSLEEALNIQMAISNPPPQTDKYRNSPAYVRDMYISSAIYDAANVNVRTEPRLINSTRKYTLSPGTSVEILGVVTGDSYQGNTTWYEIEYNNEVLYAHANLIDSMVNLPSPEDVLNVRSETNIPSHIYGVLSHGTGVNVIDKIDKWYQISFNPWRNATRDDTQSYLDPTKNDEFQHLDLSAYAGATAAELDNYLEGKGILEGKGEAFVEASQTHNINELYLVSHALLETGHGTSDLANGIEVKGETVYNMFGIGAADSNPDKLGSERAYEEEWFTPRDAIIGGAKFIGERYIHNEQEQNTLYKMRWNPVAMEETGRYGKQYATDIGWAEKQTTNLRNMHELIIDNPVLRFNIVQYRV
jgi:mannosyl-glycoprotein endo-beta-N-acetylglucosaminidase